MNRYKNKLNRLHVSTSIILFTMLISSCSKNIENLPIEEQAVYQSSRFNDDYEKDVYRRPVDVLKFIKLKPDMEILDLFGGGGYYSELFNYIVGEHGRVYLQNTSWYLNYSREELDKRLSGNRLINVTRLDSEFSDLKLPENMDVIFMGLSMHDLFVKRKPPKISAVPDSILSQIDKSLKPGGILIIIDHAARVNSGIDDTTKLHRIDEKWLQKVLEARGYRLIDTLDVLKNSDDDHSLKIWKDKVHHHTDRFIHKYRKTKDGT